MDFILKIHQSNNMKQKITKPTKSKEITISLTELSRLGEEIKNEFVKFVDCAKKSKIIVILEKQ